MVSIISTAVQADCRHRNTVRFGDGTGGFGISLAYSDDTLTVSVELWTANVVVLAFSDLLSVLDRGVGDISDVVEDFEGELLDSAIRYHYDVPPDPGPDRPRLFRFLNADDEPALEVVARTVHVV